MQLKLFSTKENSNSSFAIQVLLMEQTSYRGYKFFKHLKIYTELYEVNCRLLLSRVLRDFSVHMNADVSRDHCEYGSK